MAYVKLVREKYQEEEDVRKLIEYVCNVIKCGHLLYGGRNIIGCDICLPYMFAEQFLAVQYGRKFNRRVYHIVISFDPVLDHADISFACRVGRVISDMYPDYQSFYAVHEDKEWLHIHMVFNNCAVPYEKENLAYGFNVLYVRDTVDRMVSSHLGIPEPVPGSIHGRIRTDSGIRVI